MKIERIASFILLVGLFIFLAGEVAQNKMLSAIGAIIVAPFVVALMLAPIIVVVALLWWRVFGPWDSGAGGKEAPNEGRAKGGDGS